MEISRYQALARTTIGDQAFEAAYAEGDNTRFVRSAGLWCMISALIGIGGGIKEVLAPTTWGTPLSAMMQVLALIANALALVGVIGLARSGMVGERRLAKSSLGLALFGSALLLPLERLVPGAVV